MLGPKFSFVFALISLALSPVEAHGATRRFGKDRPLAVPVIINRNTNATTFAAVAKRVVAPELQELFEGNKKFKETVQPGLLSTLTKDGQAPPFMFIGCSDSRVAEGTIFNAKPGTLFTERNIANQFSQTDANSHAVLSYAVAELGVKHVIVMGHYGCGGVAAAIATPPEGVVDAASGAVQNWIRPIRQIFQTSTRPEIVELREKNKALAVVEEPEPEEPGFRALVEENVKASVAAIASNSVIANHNVLLKTKAAKRADHPLGNVFVHGFVYDIENGEIHNLGVSVGPPGVEMPEIPFAAVQKAGAQVAAVENGAHGEFKEKETTKCESECKSKRGL